MSKRARPARVRYYIDADLLGLAKILVQIRTDVTYPGDPGGPVKGGRRDRGCAASGARMINLAADDAIGTFAQFEVLLCQWRRIEALLEGTVRSSTRSPGRASAGSNSELPGG